MWDLPGPGHEPVSPALAGGFLTTAPPGKSITFCFLVIDINNIKLYHFFNLLFYPPLPPPPPHTHGVFEFSLADTFSSSGVRWIYSHFFSPALTGGDLVCKEPYLLRDNPHSVPPLLRIHQWFPQSSGSSLNSTPTICNIWSLPSTPGSSAVKKKKKKKIQPCFMIPGLFIHLFIQQLFFEYLLCARPCSRSQGPNSEQDNDPCPLGVDIFLVKSGKKENSKVKFIKICKEEKSNYVRNRVW